MAMTGGIGYEIDQLTELGVPELMRRQSVDPQLKYALALQQATKLVEAAARERDMAQQMPTPANVVGQMETSLAKRLAPGVQMQGQRSVQMQNRAAMGLPGQADPNLARMAYGGIVGYAEGGQPMMGPPEPNLYQRMGQGLKNYGTNAQESMDILRAAKAGVGVPYEERSAAIKQVRDQIEAEKQNRDPNFIQRMGQKLMNAGLNVEESKSILKKFYDTFGKTYEEMSNGMAMGGVVGYQEGGDVDIDALLDALMMAESGGDPRAVSDVGAEGAYQIMPATAADPGFGVRPMEGSRFDPEASREFAGDYLQAMLDRYEGDMEAALVAYNAGPANADKFVAAGKDYDVLPQAMQTQPYVSRVLRGVEKEDKPILDIGAGIENIKEGIASLFRPSRATAEARRIERGQMERQGQEAAQRGERVVEALDVPRLTPEQIANVGAAADVEVLPQAAERLPERTAVETQRRERVARREAAGIPTVAPTNVTVPTRAEAFRQTPLGNVMEVQNMMEDMYGPTPKQQPAPKKGIAGLLDRIGGTQGLLNVVETLGRGAGASKGFEAAKIVEESARARAAQEARQDQLDKLREQLEVEREKIGATQATATARAEAQLRADLVKGLSDYEGTTEYQQAVQNRIDAGETRDEAVRNVMTIRRNQLMRDLTVGGVGGMGGLDTQPGLSAEQKASLEAFLAS